MKQKKYILIIFLMFNLISVYGQKIDNDTLINDIKNDVTSFFKKQGVLKKDESNKNVFISELFDEKVIGFNSIGIYIIGVFQSHSQKHILIKENSKYKIYDIKQIDIVLKDVIDFSKRNKIGDDKMLFYLKGIIERYDANYHPNYTSIEKRQ